MTRRVVVGQRGGKSAVISDGESPRSHSFEHLPGMAWAMLWASPSVGQTGHEPVTELVTGATTTVPAPGETRFLLLQVPPDAATAHEQFDFQAAAAEIAAQQPDMAATFEAGWPAYHRTDTFDYVIVLDGEVILELDDESVKLSKLDVVVQLGARHAWRNDSDTPAVLAVILVGASPAVSSRTGDPSADR